MIFTSRIKAILLNILFFCLGFCIIGLIRNGLNMKIPFFYVDLLILVNLFINVLIKSPGYKIMKLSFKGKKLRIFFLNFIKNIAAIIFVNESLFNFAFWGNILPYILLFYLLNFCFFLVTRKQTLLEYMLRIEVVENEPLK